MHDFIVVAVLDTHIGQRRAGDHLEVPLDGHAERIKPKQVHHLRNAGAAGHAPVLAIYADREGTIQTH